MKDFVTPKISKMLNARLCSITKAVQQNLALLIVMGLLTSFFTVDGQNVDLNQVRNGSAASPVNSAQWVNGNAGPSNAHFSEGYSIPYRMYITGLSLASHELIIEWDTKEGNGHAIDYITHYSNMDNPVGSHAATFGHAAEPVDPTMGITGLGAPSTFAIPAPSSVGAEVAGLPTSSFNALAAGLRLMTIWNGTITAMAYVNQDPPDGTTSSTNTSLKITFTATSSSVVLAWGGHIAAEYDWGTGRGATGVSGSPYHTRLVSLNGKGGNQDRSLKAAAVIIPPPVCNISAAQFACPETAFLTFSSSGSSSGTGITYSWQLTNGTPSAGAKIDPATVNSADVKVVPTGATFIAGGTFSLQLTVTRSTGQSTTCERSPAGTIVKVAVAATASPTTIDLVVANTSQLDVNLSGSDDTNPANYNYSWTQNPPVGGSLSATNIRNPVFTAVLPGFYEFEVTATQKAAPGCSNKSKVTVEVVAGMPPCFVSGPTPVCPASTNQYVYDPDMNGSANAIPINFTAVWTLENANGATLVGAGPYTGNSVSVKAGTTCKSSFRIKITLTSTSGLIVVSCYKDVVVDDTEAPVITSCPGDKVLECNASVDPAATGEPTATDNCSTPTFGYKDEMETVGCQTIITRTWTATDACGNKATCIQHIVKRDRTNPVITCPTVIGNQATATDNCSATPNIKIFYTDNGNSRTWTAVDESGNIATCIQDITPPPAPAQKENIVQQSGAKNVTATTTIENSRKIPEVEKVDDLAVTAYPNPFNREVNFRFVSPRSGKAVLEVFDLVGRRIGVVYQGEVQANEQKNVTYRVSATNSSPLIYKLSVDGLHAHGKLMSSKK